MSVVGVLLAGGESRRMGAPKHSLRLPDGRTLAEVAESAMASCCEPIVVIGAADALPHRRHLAEREPRRGPLGALEAALASGLGEQYLLVPCDLPRLGATALHPLVAAGAAQVAIWGDPADRPSRFVRPLPGRYAASLLPVVREQLERGELSLRALLARATVESRPLDPAIEPMLTDVDTPEAWTRATRAAVWRVNRGP